MISAITAMPSDTRKPTSDEAMKFATVESWVDPATSAMQNTISSIAGSASAAIMTSRLEPMPPKLVPTSMPASARRATMAIRSAVQLNNRPVAKVGTSAAATQIAAKVT